MEDEKMFLKADAMVRLMCELNAAIESGEKQGWVSESDVCNQIHKKMVSSIDLKLRKIILDMCLDIEHFLKVRFLRDICDNSEEDGYNMVQIFMKSDSQGKIQITLNNEASGYSVCRDLAEKYKDCPEKLSAWTIVELLPFGAFVDFYSFYYNELYPNIKRDNYSVYLGSIKFLRNAAAHNNALLSITI